MTTFRQPVQMPEKSVFIREMLEAVFPDHTGVSNNRYFVLCEEARKAVGLEQEEELAIESDTFRLMFEINEYSESVWNITGAPMEKSALYKKFSRNELERFCDANNGVLDTWLTKKGKITVQYATAVFFTVLLVSRTACVRSREDFLQKCLSYVGITDMAAPVRNRLRQFDWQERQKETSTFFAQPFHRLTNPAIIMTGLVLLTILRLIGIDTATETGQAKFTKDITALHEKFRTFFDEEERIAAALQAAEQRLWQSMRYFEPRTIGTPQNKLKPQDFFVVPSFRNEKSQEAEEPANPAAEVCHAEKSRRCMIVGNTGQGKSMYLQMFTFCMLYHKYCPEENERVTHICEALQTVEDKYIISIPARMFSACYLQEAYRNWTEDLAALYFNCMWKLTDRDFFSQTSQMSRLKQEQPVSADFAVNDRLKSYLKALAGQGKLILVLDSYDEIVSGNMRRAYTAAVRRFCEEYCVCWQSGEVGAHVLLSGRRMSPDTMTVLYEALSISPEIDQFMIQELSMENIRDLVQNWNSFYHRDMVSRHTERFLREVAVNHFCLDYASNPYMLSVMCMNMEKGFDEITKLYTQTLSGLMRSKTRREDLDVRSCHRMVDKSKV